MSGSIVMSVQQIEQFTGRTIARYLRRVSVLHEKIENE